MYQRLIESFEAYFNSIISALPSLVSGIVVLIIGWLLAKLIKRLVERAGERTLDPFAERIGLGAVLNNLGGITLSKFLAFVIYALILLIFLTAAASIMGMVGLTNAITAFLAYLPTLFTALAIFLIGFLVAEKVKDAVGTLTDSIGLAAGRSVAKVLFAIVLLFLTITALNVAGVDTSLITSNILIVMGTMLVAFAIAYGFAAKDILTNILSSYYGKDRFKPGMRIRIGTDEGVIERIDGISVTIRTGDRSIILPARMLVSERVEILSETADAPNG